jgi:hypothetical protein
LNVTLQAKDIIDKSVQTDRTDLNNAKFKMKKLCSLLTLFPLLLSANIVSEEEAWQLGWPQLRGPYGNYNIAQTADEIIGDLSKAKLVWESESRDYGRA